MYSYFYEILKYSNARNYVIAYKDYEQENNIDINLRLFGFEYLNYHDIIHK